MLLDRIIDLSGPLPESLSDFNYILTSCGREVVELTDDGEFMEHKARKFILSSINNSLGVDNWKVLDVYRNSRQCEQVDLIDLLDVIPGSGSLQEATDYSPVYCISADALVDGTNTYNATLKIYPEISSSDTGEIFYIMLPKFGAGGIDINSINSLEDDLINSNYDYWTFVMERAFIVRVAMKILHIRLTETNIEEEDAEISQLVQSSMQSLLEEWALLKSLLAGYNEEDAQKWKSLGGGE